MMPSPTEIERQRRYRAMLEHEAEVIRRQQYMRRVLELELDLSNAESALKQHKAELDSYKSKYGEL